MSEKKDDEEKFHEIDDDRFDDADNRYFHFRNEESDGSDDGLPYLPEMDDSFMEFTDMVGGIFDMVISLLPADMQEYGMTALDAVIAAGSGNPSASNRMLKALRKMAEDGGKDSPGIFLMEARNYKSMVINALSTGAGTVEKLLKKEKKALEAYISYYDKADTFDDFDEYLFARAERARVRQMLGEQKGVFTATLEIPDGSAFDMDDLLDALNEFYEPSEDDDYTDTSFVFLSSPGNVVQIEYSDPAIVTELLSSVPLGLREKMDAGAFPGNGVVTITIDSGKDITSAAVDMQQVLAAVYSLYPDTPIVTLNSTVVQPELMPVLLEDTRSNMFCELVLLQILCEGDEENAILRSHTASAWGRPDIGIRMNETTLEPFAVVGVALDRHLRRAIKAGDHIEIEGHTFKAVQHKAGDDDIIILMEKKNG